MSDVSAALDRLIVVRRQRLPKVQDEVARWSAVDGGVAELQLALAELSAYAFKDGEGDLSLPGLFELRQDIARVIELYRVLGARFSRTTINIGVSGAARMGKSTLLQSISGLADQQIPTGEGIPVTAVRSRIFHAAASRRADLQMHTIDSFLGSVVAPYHAELGISGVPRTLQEFRTWAYPDAEAMEDGELRLLLRRLRDYQASLWSYERFLTGERAEIPLEELRPYVAYPTNEELQAPPDKVSRLYLAVREARIECSFPHPDVSHLGIIDLPGLGEVAAESDKQHVVGLRNEVDAVLLVKRSSETSSFFGKADTRTLAVLDEVRGFIRSRGEFVFIVHNVDPSRMDLAAQLRDDIRRSVNNGQDDRFYTVFETDVRDSGRVSEEMLAPLLARLASGLPIMDDEALGAARELAQDVADQISTALAGLGKELALVRDPVGVAEEIIEKKAAQLQSRLARKLSKLVADLGAAEGDASDADFARAVDDAYEGILSWADDGFGKGADEWRADAYDTMITTHNAASYAGPELNRIRVEISKRFAALDDFFSDRVRAAWTAVADIFAAECGALLEAEAGVDALRHLSSLLRESAQPCPALGQAVDSLLDVRLEYRTMLYPRVRGDLGSLNLQVTHPVTGQEIQPVAVELNEEGAEELYAILRGLAEQGAFRTRKSLLQESVTPGLVMQAVVEQFEDALIRSGESEQEFRRFARSYRNDLWPAEFQGIDEANARYARVTRAMKAIMGDLGSAA
jgi:hypothetical protein